MRLVIQVAHYYVYTPSADFEIFGILVSCQHNLSISVFYEENLTNSFLNGINAIPRVIGFNTNNFVITVKNTSIFNNLSYGISKVNCPSYDELSYITYDYEDKTIDITEIDLINSTSFTVFPSNYFDITPTDFINTEFENHFQVISNNMPYSAIGRTLCSRFENSSSFGWGTGFQINNKFVVTNAHNVFSFDNHFFNKDLTYYQKLGSSFMPNAVKKAILPLYYLYSSNHFNCDWASLSFDDEVTYNEYLGFTTFNANMAVGSSCCVIGYPGLNSYPLQYYMPDNILSINNYENFDFVVSNYSSGAGSSGSPFIVDGVICGVHNGTLNGYGHSCKFNRFLLVFIVI